MHHLSTFLFLPRLNSPVYTYLCIVIYVGIYIYIFYAELCRIVFLGGRNIQNAQIHFEEGVKNTFKYSRSLRNYKFRYHEINEK